MSAHTPGPWEWVTDIQGRGPIGKGNVIRIGLISHATDGLRRRIACPSWCTDSGGEVWQAWISVSEADARLIAAAPEMAELLRGLRFELELTGANGISARQLLADSAALLARIDGGAE